MWTDKELLAKLRENPDVEIDAQMAPRAGVVARARMDMIDPSPAFRSKAEARAWRWVDTLEPVRKWYEPLILRMPSGNYTPDFALLMPNGEVWFIEVKGAGAFKAYQSGRSSKKSTREAAYHFAWLGRMWVLIEKPIKNGGGWYLEEIEARPV